MKKGNFKVECVSDLGGSFTKGKIYKVIDGTIIFDDGNKSYDYNTVDELNSGMYSKFKLVKENQLIIIHQKGNEVIADLKNGKEVIKTVKSTCHPTDEFDFNVGAGIAFERLIGKEKKIESTNSKISKQDSYVIGDKVKLPSKRPSGWNWNGSMDEYLNKEVVITEIYGQEFCFKGSDGWFFNISEIEGNIIENEQPTYKEVSRRAKIGEYVKIVKTSIVPVTDGKEEYKIGDILKIIKVDGWYTVRYAEGKSTSGHERILDEEEYVVLEGYNEVEQPKVDLSIVTDEELLAEVSKRMIK